MSDLLLRRDELHDAADRLIEANRGNSIVVSWCSGLPHGGRRHRGALICRSDPISRPSAKPLVRHGQTEWNAIARMQGQLDSPLTVLGRERETLAILAEHVPVTPVFR